MIRQYRWLMVLGVFVLLANHSLADPVVSSTVTFDGTDWIYQYSLTNTNTGSGALFALRIIVSGPVLSVGSPAGWHGAFGFPELLPNIGIKWEDDASSYDVLVNQTLTGFSITSPAGPGTVSYFVSRDAPPQGFLQGETTGPVIPDPPSMVLICTGLIGGCIRRRYLLSKVHRAGPEPITTTPYLLGMNAQKNDAASLKWSREPGSNR